MAGFMVIIRQTPREKDTDFGGRVVHGMVTVEERK